MLMPTSFAQDDTIIALATPPGVGAIAVIRVSGKNSIQLVNRVFRGKNLEKQAGHTLHFGTLVDGNELVDEVLVSVFVAPKSFTKENSIEISCHGSPYIVKQILKLLLTQGARMALPGEFTRRAFLNGQFDLAQAEAVADLITADTEASHKAALNQMRGGFSQEIKKLREELIHFASMIELELDFGEEDVEFASREDLKGLIFKLLTVINSLISSFDMGNVIKNGVPTVIAGKPNAGKSTLLNALLNEEKAIVSDIPGTTRDFIEDELNIGGIIFRFIDTAGLRETTDTIEAIGVARTREKMEKAALIIFLFDLSQEPLADMMTEVERLKNTGIPFIPVGNKVDTVSSDQKTTFQREIPTMVFLSAASREGLEELKDALVARVNTDSFQSGDVVVTNVRHWQSLLQTKDALDRVISGIEGQVTGDFLAMDIRQSLHFLGEITGEITTEDLLDNIFSKFCIGK
jgi:tRNA modification GTPase